MGIPKFFRYISERYPLTSQLIQENKIPEFDNLYLDFNGVIHQCSHPNDGDAHFRLSEEQIFTSIFAYVDFLFGKIKPKKLFFLAIDGVAPRAKMNQQRSRRFRSAKEAKEVKEKAERKGEKLPDEAAFDSNCITPGTEFMAKLSAQLKYFVNKKISEDANWRNVQVILSGHEVPGEGEHKVMEYIRHAKAQPDYNPNIRHCLYGLDADLIMLGLLSHDPHFCLLREEVKFGPQKKKATGGLDAQNFFLLHLSLLREYLDLEFRSMAQTMSFPYNLERVIDDFILIAVFVGNDFLPHLPDLHINENALEKLFDLYKKVIPTAGGYLQDSGTINTQRLQLILDELAKGEREVFEKENADLLYVKGKQKKHNAAAEAAHKTTKTMLTQRQKELFEQIKAFVMSQRGHPDPNASIKLVNDFPANMKRFLQEVTAQLHLELTWDEYDEDDRNLAVIRLPPPEDDDDDEEEENGDWEDVDDEEGNAAVDRVLKKFDKMKVIDDGDEGEDFDAREEKRMQARMDEWKRNYYREKLEFDYNDPKPMHDLIYRYVEGLQWVMYYYYSGVASWSWFYNYHYAPRMSDLKGVADMKFHFELGQPFKPFEQLMGVMPEASKELLPVAYRDLMYDVNSPILDFYPQTFEQDMNGKKAEWEAVVKIPFIDQKRLLAAMAPRERQLTEEERRRNTWGPSTRFIYDPDNETVYPSSLPGFFPALVHNHCRMEPYFLPTLDGLHLVPGLCDGVFLGAQALAGFPSLFTLEHTAMLGFHHVNVFQGESRNQSMIINVINKYEGMKTEDLAKKFIGKRVFLNWPFLQEGLCVAVSDEHFKHEEGLVAGKKRIVAKPQTMQDAWRRKADRIEHMYSKRFAVLMGDVEVLLHVRPLRGLKRLDTGALVKDYEDADKELEQAVQLGVTEVFSEDQRFLEKDAPPLSEEFPDGSKVIFLGEHAYGVAAQVRETSEISLTVVLAFFPNEKAENDQFTQLVKSRPGEKYLEAHVVARILGMSGLAFAKITSSLMVITSDAQKTNIGLSLKFEAKGMKVLGYTRKGRTWEFSEKAVQLIRDYKKFAPELFTRLDQRREDMTMAQDLFPNGDADTRVKEIREFLNRKGIRDLEPTSLLSEQLDKDTVGKIEQLANEFNSSKSADMIKKALVKGIPRQAVLKPGHAVYRLLHQTFALGDRVTMVQDSGSVPLTAKGVVVGLNTTSIDVVWDVPFMSGTTLGGRCSQYRGSTVTFNSCLNLSHKQYVMSTNPTSPTVAAPANGNANGHTNGAHNNGMPVNAPYGAVRGFAPIHPPRGAPRGGFRGGRGGMAIMQNPARQTAAPPALYGGYGEAVKNELPAEQPAAQPVSQSDMLRETLLGGAPRARGRGRGFPPHHNTPARGAGHHINGPQSSFRGGPPVHLLPTVPFSSPQQPANTPAGGFADRGRGRGRGRGGFRGAPRGRGGHNPAGQAQTQAQVPASQA